MIHWDNFIWFAVPVFLCWTSAILGMFLLKNRTIGILLSTMGIVIFTAFIIVLWMDLERPPMRTMGETRLWYALFLSLVGTLLYVRWKFRWILAFSLLLSSVFLLINLLNPEIHSKNLMPALQSVWFVPHVIAYIIAYSFLSAAAISATIMLVRYNKLTTNSHSAYITDNLVYIGFGLLMIGLLIGAIWAKEAWGTYWSWDPKETWALITAVAYLIYIHMRLRENKPKRLTLSVLIVALMLLLFTWKGVNYLPSAQNSVHVYTQ